MIDDYRPNYSAYQVWTPRGFMPFGGVACMGLRETVIVAFDRGTSLECTIDHKLFRENGVEVAAGDLIENDEVLAGTYGTVRVVSVTPTGARKPVYDLVDVAGGNRYDTNGVLSHNCEFVADDETLIESLRLAAMVARDPDYFTGTVRWYHDPEPNKAYLVGLDPSLGTGGDCAAIQVYQLPEMKQVAEWQHNATPPRGQVRILMQVLIYLDTILREDRLQSGEPELFWSFENNSIGEAILTIIEDTGEERFPGILVNDRRSAGQSRRFRKGMTTTNRNKLSACSRLKSLIESSRMEVNSRNLLREFKNFVATESSFKAKPGESDDLIMALILIVRMLDVAIQWVPEGHDLREHIDEDELLGDEPMPVSF